MIFGPEKGALVFTDQKKEEKKKRAIKLRTVYIRELCLRGSDQVGIKLPAGEM